MTILVSSQFSAPASGTINNTVLDNGDGGSGTYTWATTQFQIASGGGKVAGDGPGARAQFPFAAAGAYKSRIYFDPNGGTSPIMLWGNRDAEGTGANFLSAMLDVNQTKLQLREGISQTPPSGTIRAELTVTPPGTPFWLELEINYTALVATARVLNADTSVRNEASYTFTTMPSGVRWGFGFVFGTATGFFDRYQIHDLTTPAPPAGTVTITSVTPGATTASVVYSYDDTDEDSFEYRLDGGTAAAIGASPATITGLTDSTTYDIEVRAINADGNGAWSAVESFTTTTPDTTAPTLSSPTATVLSNALIAAGVTTDEANGTLYVVATTSATPPSAAQIRAGQDHTGAAAAFADDQAISSTGAKTFNVTGLTQLTLYYLYFHHQDAAGNNSTVSSASGTTFKDGATGQAIVDDTAAIPGVQEEGILFNDVELPADADKWFTYDVVTPVVDTASLTLFPNGSLIWTGTSADSFTYQLKVDGVEVGSPQLVTLTPVGEADTEDPVLTGDITVTDLTDTSYTLSWPAATDNVGVTGYEVSLNNGSSYTPVGLVLTTDISGRTALATDLVRVRAFDAAGNRSGFLSSSVTLLDTPDTTPPELSLPTATATGATTADATVTTDEAGGALFWVRTANLTEDKNDVVAAGATQPVTAIGLQTYGVTGMDPESTGRVHTVHRDAAGNVSDTVSSAEFTTNAFGGGGANGKQGLALRLGLGL